jgi:hypothetical protein
MLSEECLFVRLSDYLEQRRNMPVAAPSDPVGADAQTIEEDAERR